VRIWSCLTAGSLCTLAEPTVCVSGGPIIALDLSRAIGRDLSTSNQGKQSRGWQVNWKSALSVQALIFGSGGIGAAG
jgi:hypothetical protein